MRAELPRVFRWFWAGETASSFGSWITILTLQVIVVDYLHAGTVGLGWMNAARWLPYLLFGLVLGALIDRVRRRPVMIASDLVRALLLCTIPVLWVYDLLNLSVLLALAVLVGTATLVNDSASQAFVPRLIPPRSLQTAHARIDGTNAVAETAGPAIGGGLLAVLAAPFALLVNVATFLFSAIVVALVQVEEPRRPEPDGSSRPSLRREIAAGLNWVYSTPSLRDLAMWTHVWFAAQAILAAVSVDYFLNDLGIDVFWLGIVMAGGGLGGIIGALASQKVGERLGNGRAVILAHVCSAAGALVLLTASLPVEASVLIVFGGVCLHGFAIGLSNSHEMAYRQSLTPDAFQARTNTTMRSMNRAVIVIVSPLAGILAAATSAELTLIVAAVIFALTAIGLWFSPFRTVRISV